MSDQEAIRLEITVSYNQLCVFDAEMENPFNDWNDIHVRQGFSWRHGSVSFGTIDNKITLVNVVTSDIEPFGNEYDIVIVVPFDVPQHGKLVIGSIGDEKEFRLAPGTYELWYQFSNLSEQARCLLKFLRNSNPKARVFKVNTDFTADTPLLLEAVPAI